MSEHSFLLNGQVHRSASPAGTVLLEEIRDVACLSGTKEACREGECGACAVLVGRPGPGGLTYRAVASCLLPLGDVAGCHVVTVEGLGGERLSLVQQLILDHGASQCGFCTPGIVLSLTGFALQSPDFAAADALAALDGNLCRCTGYVAIRAAARDLAARLARLDADPGRRVAVLVDAGVLPASFLAAPAALAGLAAASPSGTAAEAGAGSAVVVAGGTDLFVQRPEQLREGELCFLARRPELAEISEGDGVLRVGGAVTIEELRRSPLAARRFPSLRDDLLLHSSALLRNRATLAGNVVNASPIGDATILLLALDARLVLRGAAERVVPLERFYRGYKQVDLACGELVAAIEIPFLPEGGRFHFEKVSNRVVLDIAAVNAALRLTVSPDGKIRDLRVAAGGVAPVPLLVPNLDRFVGARADVATGAAVAEAAAAAAAPIDDVRGSAAYKRLLLRQLVHACFLAPEVLP